MIKRTLLVFAISCSAIMLSGCGGSGPSVSPDDKAKQSMDETMNMEFPAEIDPESGGAAATESDPASP